MLATTNISKPIAISNHTAAGFLSSTPATSQNKSSSSSSISATSTANNTKDIIGQKVRPSLITNIKKIAASTNYLSTMDMKENTTTTPESIRRMKNLEVLEQRLNDATKERESIRKDIEQNENELSKLIGQPKSIRPRETVGEIDDQINKLERRRETNSMPLAAEREILKQIYKLKKNRGVVEEFELHDAQIKATKERLGTLRQQVREEINPRIAQIKLEYDTAKMAYELGCEVTELVGRRFVCPADKLAQVLGKKGKMIREIQSSANVDVNIVKTNSGEIRILGTLDALDKAVSGLDKVINQKELTISVPEKLVVFLTTKHITALAEIRACYPSTYCSIQKDKKFEVSFRGLQEDIDAMKEDLLKLASNLSIKSITTSTKDASIHIVGKQGAIIDRLVSYYQVAIDVTRQHVDTDIESNDGDNKSQDNPKLKSLNSNNTGNTEITLIGITDNVELAYDTITKTLAENKEESVVIPTGIHVRAALLAKAGNGMQALQKKVNEAVQMTPNIRDTTVTDDEENHSSTSYYVSLSFHENGIVVKTRRKVLSVATAIIHEEINRIDQMKCVLQVDPVALPVLIGKGGEGVKTLLKNHDTGSNYDSVHLQFDRAAGTVIISGMDATEISNVANSVSSILEQNQVHRMSLGDIPCNGSNANAAEFQNQFRDLMRSKGKEIRELVFVLSDDENCRLVLRGPTDKISKTVTIINNFINLNYTEVLELTADDMKALLTGGKESKIVEFSALSSELKINSDRDRNRIVIKGIKENVLVAVTKIKAFLYGGNGIVATKICLDNEVMGLIIGRAGKSKKELEEKYPTVSIMVSAATLKKKGDDDISMNAVDSTGNIILRGPEKDVMSCRIDIQKQVLSARVTRKYSIPIPKPSAIPKPTTVGLATSTKSNKNKKKKSNQQAYQHQPAPQPAPSVELNQTIIRQLFSKESVFVQTTVSNTDKAVTLRGTLDNVHAGITFLRELYENGLYESSIFPGLHAYKKVKMACCNDSSSYFKRIEVDTKCSIILDDQNSCLIVKSLRREHAKSAKLKLISFFEFLLGTQFKFVQLSSPLQLGIIIKSMVDISIESECTAHIFTDRDLLGVMVFGTECSSLNSISDTCSIVQAKLTSGNSAEGDLVHVMKFDASDDWVLSSFIGRKGSSINKLRKVMGSNCQIDVDSKVARTITMKAKDLESFTRCKTCVEETIDKIRKETVFLSVPTPSDMAAFVGKGGMHINEFSKRHNNVNVQIVKTNNTEVVRISGADSSHVTLAKEDFEQWLENRPKSQQNDTSFESEASIKKTLKVRPEQIPIIIGTKGIVIQSLQEQYKCKIDVDKITLLVTVHRASTIEQAEAVIQRIKDLLHGDVTSDEIIGQRTPNKSTPTKTVANNLSNDTNDQVEETDTRNEIVSIQLYKSDTENERSPLVKDIETEFPLLKVVSSTLSGKENSINSSETELVTKSKSDESVDLSTTAITSGVKKQSWANVVLTSSTSAQSSIVVGDHCHIDSIIDDEEVCKEVHGTMNNVIPEAEQELKAEDDTCIALVMAHTVMGNVVHTNTTNKDAQQSSHCNPNDDEKPISSSSCFDYDPTNIVFIGDVMDVPTDDSFKSTSYSNKLTPKVAAYSNDNDKTSAIVYIGDVTEL